MKISILGFGILIANLALAENIILLGDTGKDTSGQKAVAAQLKNECPANCSSVFLVGDNVYDDGISSANDPLMKKVFADYYTVLKVPFHVILGNHDNGKLSNNFAKGRFQVEYSKINPQFSLPSEFYSFETEDLVVAALDTSRLMWNKDIETQANLVKAAHATAKAKNKWFIVLGHHPYLSNGKHGNAGKYEGITFPPAASGKYVKAFIEAHVCGKAEFYFSGHDHNLQVIDANQKTCDLVQIVSGSGGSTEDWRESSNKLMFGAKQLGYFRMETSPNLITIEAKNEKGQSLYKADFKR